MNSVQGQDLTHGQFLLMHVQNASVGNISITNSNTTPQAVFLNDGLDTANLVVATDRLWRVRVTDYGTYDGSDTALEVTPEEIAEANVNSLRDTNSGLVTRRVTSSNLTDLIDDVTTADAFRYVQVSTNPDLFFHIESIVQADSGSALVTFDMNHVFTVDIDPFVTTQAYAENDLFRENNIIYRVTTATTANEFANAAAAIASSSTQVNTGDITGSIHGFQGHFVEEVRGDFPLYIFQAAGGGSGDPQTGVTLSQVETEVRAETLFSMFNDTAVTKAYTYYSSGSVNGNIAVITAVLNGITYHKIFTFNTTTGNLMTTALYSGGTAIVMPDGITIAREGTTPVVNGLKTFTFNTAGNLTGTALTTPGA